MKYYDEEKMKNLRLKFDTELLSWPNVTTKKMYGCPCYKNKDKLFAFLVIDGIVITKPTEKDKIQLKEEFNAKPFTAANRTMKNWPQIPLNNDTNIEEIIPYIKNSYKKAVS